MSSNHPCFNFLWNSSITTCCVYSVQLASQLSFTPSYLKWLNWFYFLILMGRFAHILIGCIIFLLLFLDPDVVIRMSMSTVFYSHSYELVQTLLWNSLPAQCLLSLTCDLNDFKLTDNFFYGLFLNSFVISFSSFFSCNSMSHWLFSLLLGVKPISLKKSFIKNYLTFSYLFSQLFGKYHFHFFIETQSDSFD